MRFDGPRVRVEVRCLRWNVVFPLLSLYSGGVIPFSGLVLVLSLNTYKQLLWCAEVRFPGSLFAAGILVEVSGSFFLCREAAAAFVHDCAFPPHAALSPFRTMPTSNASLSSNECSHSNTTNLNPPACTNPPTKSYLDRYEISAQLLKPIHPTKKDINNGRILPRRPTNNTPNLRLSSSLNATLAQRTQHSSSRHVRSYDEPC